MGFDKIYFPYCPSSEKAWKWKTTVFWTKWSPNLSSGQEELTPILNVACVSLLGFTALPLWVLGMAASLTCLFPWPGSSTIEQWKLNLVFGELSGLQFSGSITTHRKKSARSEDCFFLYSVFIWWEARPPPNQRPIELIYSVYQLTSMIFSMWRICQKYAIWSFIWVFVCAVFLIIKHQNQLSHFLSVCVQ